MITIEHIEKKYNKSRVKAVSDVTFEIKDNEIFGLLGPNGAGKTTTMRMISTLLKPTSGVIKIDGENICNNAEEIKKKISFLTNEIRFDGQFTPNQLATFYGLLYGMDEKTLKNNREYLFDYFGISEYADRKYETFSTGMKQKTSIAICLIHDPQIIIFDEPTNGLDILTQKLVEDMILGLKKKGKCIIISTHILDVIERLSDRIGVIIDGRSVFCGTCNEMTEAENAENVSEAFLKIYEKNHKEIVIEKSKGKGPHLGR